MEKYNVGGMSCAACVARVEKAVSKVPGVQSCAVSLLTNSMGVEGDVSPKKIIAAVQKAGYSASLIGEPKVRELKNSGAADSLEKSEKQESSRGESDSSDYEGFEDFQKKEISILKNRLIFSLIFLIILMYFSMGHMMWNFPIPSWFTGNHVAMGLVQMILAAVIMLINKKFFTNGFKSLFHFSPNMDTLVALGSGVSFLYSLANLFSMTKAVVENNSEKVMYCMENFYFESAAMIVTLITVGKLLEAVSKGKTTSALKSLMKLKPKTAVILFNGEEKTVPVESVNAGDIFIIRPGDSIPVDGIILEGESSINESALTGESIPVDKKQNDSVSSGTLNLQGYLKCKAVKVGSDTTLSKIIQMVSDVAATKAPIAKIADKVSGVFVPSVMIISIITFTLWMILGAEFSYALSRAICVLVVSCPCALGLATPVAIMVGNGIGAKNGILFKTSAALENCGKCNAVVLDKTGTVTLGQPVVTEIIPSDSISENQLLLYAASLEQKSEHPLGKAVVQKSVEEKLTCLEVSDFKVLAGNGLECVLEGKKIYGGKIDFIKNVCTPDDSVISKIDSLCEEGKTPLLFAFENKMLGIICVSDVLKPDSKSAVSCMKNMGLEVFMLTGDNQKTAAAIAKNAGINHVIANVLPNEKANEVQRLKSEKKVCMVGDGINDAPALTAADIGIAIGSGTDVAVDAAEIVLVQNSLMNVVKAIRLSKATVRNIHENLFWAFFYNIILIPVAAGAYHHAFGIDMNPMLGAAAMSLSSFCVVTNALRLRYKKLEVKSMAETFEKTIKVEGMMCNHCEMHVKESLEKVKGIETATPSHEKGTVVLNLSKDVSESALEKAVKKAGYTFAGIL